MFSFARITVSNNYGKMISYNFLKDIEKIFIRHGSVKQKFSSSSLLKCQRDNVEKVEGSDLLNDPEVQHKLEALKVELENYRQSDHPFIPVHVAERHWLKILKLPTVFSRLKYYKCLRHTELKSMKKKEEHQKLKQERWNKKQKTKNHLMYGLNENFIMYQVFKSNIDMFYENNLMHAVLFGQDLIFDMRFEEIMTPMENADCFNQLRHVLLENRRDRDPFHIHFCNVAHNSNVLEKLRSSILSLRRRTPLVTVTEQSYLELFPKEKLVYLTPHCCNDLEFNHDNVYIIGGLVDRCQHGAASLAVAKADGLQMARFPLDKYLQWKQGKKALTLKEVLKILLTVRNTSDWKEAFKHIPEKNHTTKL